MTIEFTDFDDDQSDGERRRARIRASGLHSVGDRELLEELERQRVHRRVRARLATECARGQDTFVWAMAEALASGISAALGFRGELCDLFVAAAERRRHARTEEELEEFREAIEDEISDRRGLGDGDLLRLFPELDRGYRDPRWSIEPDDAPRGDDLAELLTYEVDQIIPRLAGRFVDAFRELAGFEGNHPDDEDYLEVRITIGDWTIAEVELDGEVYWFDYGEPEISQPVRHAHRAGDDETRWRLLRDLSLAEGGGSHLYPDVAVELAELEQRFGDAQPGSGS